MTQRTSAVAAPTEADAIARWRFNQLVAAGYEPESASLLAARSDIDLHLAVDLVGKGCPPETAIRILT